MQKIGSLRWAQLLAFIFPGAGHLALGMPLKGLLLIACTLTDLIAMIRFGSAGGGKYALLIVYLGLTLPYLWFYSVFDALQQTAVLRDGRRDEVGRQQLTSGQYALQGGGIVVLGLLLLCLVRESSIWSPWLNQAGLYAPGIGLIAIAVAILVGRRTVMLKMGRFTAAAIIITVGGLLLWDQLKGSNHMELLGQWWPAAFVLLGLEVISFGLIFRRKTQRLSFDMAGCFMAIVIAGVAFGITQYSAMPIRWLDQWKDNIAGMVGYGEEKGFKYELDPRKIELTEELQTISILNPNGEVKVQHGKVDHIELRTTIWVDSNDQAEADEVVAESTVQIEEGKKLSLEAKGKMYGTNANRKPRMNILLIIPDNSHFVIRPDEKKTELNLQAELDTEAQLAASDDGVTTTEDNQQAVTDLSKPNEGADTQGDTTSVVLEQQGQHEQTGQELEGEKNQQNQQSGQEENGQNGNVQNEPTDQPEPIATELIITVSNGSVNVNGLFLPGGLKAKVTNGEITVHDVAGKVEAETKNGGIQVSKITGDVHLETYNGNVSAEQIEGALEGSTLSGSMDVTHVSGAIEVSTKNGQIMILDAASRVKADTLNGDIEIASPVVAGNWNVDSSIGEIRLYVPEDGNYAVNGSVTFGEVSTDLPLIASKKTITGEVGTAEYRININANSSIMVNQYIP